MASSHPLILAQSKIEPNETDPRGRGQQRHNRFDVTADMALAKRRYDAFLEANRDKLKTAGIVLPDAKLFDAIGKLSGDEKLAAVGNLRESLAQMKRSISQDPDLKQDKNLLRNLVNTQGPLELAYLKLGEEKTLRDKQAQAKAAIEREIERGKTPIKDPKTLGDRLHNFQAMALNTSDEKLKELASELKNIHDGLTGKEKKIPGLDAGVEGPTLPEMKGQTPYERGKLARKFLDSLTGVSSEDPSKSLLYRSLLSIDQKHHGTIRELIGELDRAIDKQIKAGQINKAHYSPTGKQDVPGEQVLQSLPNVKDGKEKEMIRV